MHKDEHFDLEKDLAYVMATHECGLASHGCDEAGGESGSASSNHGEDFGSSFMSAATAVGAPQQVNADAEPSHSGAGAAATVGDVFSWDDYNLTQAEGAFGLDVLDRIIACLAKWSFRTNFAGIGAPECALLKLAGTLGDRLGKDVTPMRHLYAIELDEHNVEELIRAPHAPEYVILDMNSFYAPGVKARIDKLKAKGKTISYDDLLPIIKTPRSIRLSSLHFIFAGLMSFQNTHQAEHLVAAKS